MKKLILLSVAILFSYHSKSQNISRNKQIALNNYMKLSIDMVKDVEKTITCLDEFYGDMINAKKHKTGLYKRYVCGKIIENYLMDAALNKNTELKQTHRNLLNISANNMIEKYNLLVEKCQELDIYVKLKDYESDGFTAATKMLHEISKRTYVFREAKRAHEKDVYSVYRQLQPYSEAKIYLQLEEKMRKIIADELKLMDGWSRNLNSKIHTVSIPVERLQKNINYIQLNYRDFADVKGLKRPAAAYYRMFMKSYFGSLSKKRMLIDENNYEARQNDHHNKFCYKEMYNYINHTLISNFNAYADIDDTDGQRAVLYGYYCQVFDIKKSENKSDFKIIPFIDKSYNKINVTIENKNLSNEIVEALNNYLIFINKDIRRCRNMYSSLRSINRTINNNLDTDWSTVRRGPTMNWPKNYKLPSVYYHTAKIDSRFIPEQYRTSLNTQVDNLMSIIIEKNQLSRELTEYLRWHKYLKDLKFSRAYEILKRLEKLLLIYDERKEGLYNDVRAIYNSYNQSEPKSPWVLSGNALLALVDQDRQLLSDGRRFFIDDSSQIFDAEQIQKYIRTVLAAEYKNMKGLSRIGRNHGGCPYTPYNDISMESKTFANKIVIADSLLKKKKLYNSNITDYGFYEDFVFDYNSIIRAYNKFTTLANGTFSDVNHDNINNVWLLMHILQPGVYRFVPPTKAENIDIYVKKTDFVAKNIKPIDQQTEEELYTSMEGYAENNMVLLLDISSSMNALSKLPLLKKSLKRLLTIMRDDDEISIVVYSGSTKVALKPTSATDTKIAEVIDNLKGGGGTDVEKGIKLAYKIATKNFKEGGNNRIILASDGQFATDDNFLRIIEKNSKSKIYLSVFAFGIKGNTETLESIAKIGGGNFEIITKTNTDIKLVKEAKAKALPKH